MSLLSSLIQAWVGRGHIDQAESRYTGDQDTKAASARAPAGIDGQLTAPLLSAAEKGTAGKTGQGSAAAGSGSKEEKEKVR